MMDVYYMYLRRGGHHGYPLATSRALMRPRKLPDVLIVVTSANYTYVPLFGTHVRVDWTMDGRECKFTIPTTPWQVLASKSKVEKASFLASQFVPTRCHSGSVYLI
jgi:hypothetical protein